MPSNTAIAVIDGKPITLEVLLDRAKGEIAKALPFQMPVDRLYRVAITTVRKSPELQNCNALSIVACVIQGAQLGLELDGVLGNAYMVPYAAEANFQIGYKGLIALSYRSPTISRIDANWACEGDQFYYEYGTNAHIEHIPKNESDVRTHYYCIVYLSDGTFVFMVMTKEAIDNHRDKYSKAAQSKKTSPWDTSYDAMALKTVIRQTLKTTPISTDIQTAISLDEQAEAGIPQQLAKDLSEEIVGTSTGEPVAEAPIVDHNRDEYPGRGKHSEKGKEPKIWTKIPLDYLEWVIKTVKKEEPFRDRAIAELNARKLEEQGTQRITDAEFENNVIPASIEKLLEHPVLSEEEVNEWKSLIHNEENPPEEWLAKQESIIRGIIADKERDADKQGQQSL